LQAVIQTWKDLGYGIVLTDSANSWSAFELFGVPTETEEDEE